MSMKELIRHSKSVFACAFASVALSGCLIEIGDEDDDPNDFFLPAFLIVNDQSNDVVIIESGEDEIEERISVGTSPTVAAFENDQFLVVNTGSNTVTVFGAASASVSDPLPLETIRVGEAPAFPAGGNNRFVVPNSADNTISVIFDQEIERTTAVGQEPVWAAYASGVFMVANASDNTISILDSEGRLDDTVSVLSRPVQVIDNGSDRFLVLHEEDSRVLLLESDGDVVDTITLPALPVTAAYGEGVYAVPVETGEVFFINPANGDIEDAVDTNEEPTFAAFGDNRFMVIADTQATLIDGRDFTIDNTFNLAQGAVHIEFGRGQFAIANSSSNIVTLIDSLDGDVETIAVEESPSFIVFGE